MIEESKKDQDVDFKVVSDTLLFEPPSEITYWQKAIFSLMTIIICALIVLALIQAQRISGLRVENESLQATITAFEGGGK